MLFKIRDNRGDTVYVESSDYKIHTKVVHYTKGNDEVSLKLVFTLSIGMDSQEIGELELLEILDFCLPRITGIAGGVTPNTKIYLDGFAQAVSDFITIKGNYLTIFRDLKHNVDTRRELREYMAGEYNEYLKEVDRGSVSTLREIIGC